MSNSPNAIVMEEPKEVVLAGGNSDTNQYERLILIDTVPPSDGAQDSNVTLIDVVHVSSLCSVDDRHKLSELLDRADTTGNREFVFQSELCSFLAGNLVQEYVQQEAMYLLRALLVARRPATPDKRKAIIFVAYDLGALVVKQALSIAAGFQNEYSSIFWDTFEVIFSGCPQRRMDICSMISKLWTFLSGELDTNAQHLLIPQIMENLAHMTMQTSEAFISSKIALRAHIIHLYAGEDEAGMIHPSMDAFTATMGLSSETVIQEHSKNDWTPRFPGLSKIIAYNLEDSAFHPDWLPIEQTLLALAAPPQTSQLDPREVTAFQPALDAQEHVDWDNCHRPQILHIQGRSHRLTHSVADLVMLQGIAKLRQRDDYNLTSYLSFSFDSRDPQRCSIPNMIISILASTVSGSVTGIIEKNIHMFRDLFLMRGGWSDKSSISMFEAVWPSLFPRGFTIILHDFDECDRDSRRTFLNYYSALANKTETPLKFVITSREPNTLTVELEQWPKLEVDAYVTGTASETRKFVTDPIKFCPSNPKRQEIQERLNRLSEQGQPNLHTILGLLFDHTSWPNNPSDQSLSEFIHLLSLISPFDTPERVLDKIIRFDRNSDRLRWVLSWLLCSYRPLSLRELATVVEYYDKSNTTGPESSTQSVSTQPSTEARKQLRSWLRMLTDFRDDQATIRPDIMSLLVGNTDTESYIWNEVTGKAHQNLTKFCLACLKSDEDVASLRDTALQYESALQEEQQRFKLSTLVLPRDEGLILYAVQALPYHLSKCPSGFDTKAPSFFLDKSTTTVSTLWAKVYWAMSNPLSRTPVPPESALPVCASLGFLSLEKLATETENLRVQCMSSAIISGRGSEVLGFFPPGALAVSTCMELLLSALQANDQNTALELAHGVLSNPKWDRNTQAWPHFAIWSAVWLNMLDLTELLLDKGGSVDSKPSVEPTIGYYPSILHMSSMLNNSAIVEALLARGATSKKPVLSRYTSFQIAAGRGHIDVVQKYLEHDASHVKDREPCTALWVASEWGCWHSVSTLIGAGADANEPQGNPPDDYRSWRPLAVACREGNTKTVEELLAGKADANAVGPYGVDTALWFPAFDTPNVDCVRVMLSYNADPNHHHFNPPLLIEMASSSHDTSRLLPICDALLNGTRPINLNATNDDGQTALMKASQSGKLGLVQWLLRSGADTDVLDRFDKSALYYAIDKVDFVAALLEKKARINVTHASGEAPLLFNAISHPEIVQLLLDSGADPNLTDSSGNMAINMASAYGRVETVKILIERGADINHKDSYGWAPIFDAVGYSCDNALTRLLAENGAKMDGMARDETLLHLALGEDFEILKTLLEFRKSIDINALNKAGCTALHSAIYSSDIKYLQALIKAGADLNVLDPNGETPLHWAARTAEALEHLKLLLSQQDIDLDKPCQKWGSPLCIASQKLNVEAVRALLDRGADVNLSIPNILPSTPLVSVLGTNGCTTRSEDILTIDLITRMLIFNPLNKAEVRQTVPGSRFYTALAAACLSAGPTTLKLLIEEGAEIHLADTVSGRLPHHFAAANGFDNFQAIVLSYRGDLMASDKEEKNCLHWAAQFGNLKTVEFIISRLRIDERLAHYINRPDSDGWTPLCWAARPCEGSWASNMGSEQPDFAGIVKALLLNGARPDVKCTLGNGTDTEKLTPIDLAQRCDAGEDIITMLQQGVGKRTDSMAGIRPVIERPVRIYALHRATCDVCFKVIFGLVFNCSTCADYYICTKCLPHKETFHTKETQGDEKEHELKQHADYDEYRDMPDGEEENRGGPAPDEQVVDGERDGSTDEVSSEREEEILDLNDIEI